MAAAIFLAAMLVFLTCPGAGAKQASIRLNRVDSSLYPTNFLNVTVLGPGGKPLEGLKPANFTVTEDNKEQKVLDVAQSDEKGAPIHVALVLDCSGSMNEAMQDTRNAAKAFLKNLSPGDRVAVMTFSDESSLECGFTSDHGTLEAAIDGIRPMGATALYRSIVDALLLFGDAQAGNKAVIVLTDGKNNKFGTPYECVMKSLAMGVPIYTVGLGEDVDRDILAGLAEETGGFYRYAPTSGELEEIYRSLASQLKSQLWVKYQAEPQKWPRTKVRASIMLKDTPGAGASSSLGYLVPLQWWKLILGYLLLEVVLILACYLLFRILWQKGGMDPVLATRLSILALFVLTCAWYAFVFMQFIPVHYFALIGLAQLFLLLIPLKALSN
jgi:VWFA-related protein